MPRSPDGLIPKQCVASHQDLRPHSSQSDDSGDDDDAGDDDDDGDGDDDSKGWGLSVKLGKHSAIWGKLGTALQACTLNPCTKFPPNPTSRKVNT